MIEDRLDTYLLTLLLFAIVFFPGIVGTFVLLKLRYCRNKTSFYFLMYSFVIGITSYFFSPSIRVTLEGEKAINFSAPSLSFIARLISGDHAFFFQIMSYMRQYGRLLLFPFLFIQSVKECSVKSQGISEFQIDLKMIFGVMFLITTSLARAVGSQLGIRSADSYIRDN